MKHLLGVLALCLWPALAGAQVTERASITTISVASACNTGACAKAHVMVALWANM